jgi:fluoride exporter
MRGTAETWLLVALAGGAGSLLRYALGGWLARTTGGVFPWETLTINVLGSLAIGSLAAMVDRGHLLSPVTRMALMAGFLGGFTTFSSFALETFRLAQDAQWVRAGLYVVGTNAIGVFAVWAGYRLLQAR